MRGGKPLRRLALMMITAVVLASMAVSCGRQSPVYTMGAEIKKSDDPNWFLVNKAWIAQQDNDIEALLAALKQCRELK